MPFTPFHIGPGIAVKVVAGRHFSLLVFGFSQVAIDLEPLVRILRRDDVLHGFTHTYLGATLLGLASVVVGRPVCQFFLRRWNPGAEFPFQMWLRGDGTIPWPAAILGAFVGTYSHVLLDSIMHFDMHPFAPFSLANGMRHVITNFGLHTFCVLSGVAGVLATYATYLVHRRSNRRLPEA